MSEYEIELDLENALNCLDEAIREYPLGHIRVRRGTMIVSERVPPRIPG
jgi:hypothetical protein